MFVNTEDTRIKGIKLQKEMIELQKETVKLQQEAIKVLKNIEKNTENNSFATHSILETLHARL